MDSDIDVISVTLLYFGEELLEMQSKSTSRRHSFNVGYSLSKLKYKARVLYFVTFLINFIRSRSHIPLDISTVTTPL